MASVAERFATMERCRSCLTVLPAPPAPRVCPNCSRVKVVPRHSDWSHALKVWLLIKQAERNLFFPWRSMQDSWELLLIGAYERRQVNGRIIRQGVSPDDVYAMAVTDSEAWKAAGSKTDFL